MSFSKKIKAIRKKRERNKEIKKMRKEKFEGYKKRLKTCRIEELTIYLEQIENNGFSPKEIKKMIESVLIARKDLDKEQLDRIREIGERNKINDIDYLIFEYEKYGIA